MKVCRCIYCEGDKDLEAGRCQTFGYSIECYHNYLSARVDPQNMKEFANCINMPLITGDKDELIEESMPPPELHLMMGSVNHCWSYFLNC